MTTSLDYILLPIHRQNDRDLAEIPGLLAAQAPRRAARGRTLDTFVVQLALVGTAPLSPKGYRKLVGHLVDLYFKTPGSSTAAMRTVAEWLNDYLIERNLRGATRSMQSVGLLNLVVFRSNRFYLAQCGPTNAFYISSEGFRHYHESDLVGRGLGLGRVTKIRYHQDAFSPNDLLILSADPPPIWTKAVLNGLRGMSLNQMHLRLIHQIGPELEATLINVETGSGKLRVLRPEPLRGDQKPPGTKLESQEPEKVRDIEPSEAKPLNVSLSPQEFPPTPKLTMDQETEIFTDVVSDLPQSTLPQGDVSIAPTQDAPKQVPLKPKRQRIVGPALLKIGQAFGDTLLQGSKGISRLAKRMLPDETLLSIPTSVMAFIAIAVPFVVVAIAATVYFQRGRVRLFEEHYLQAEYAAEQALQLSDAPELRDAWHVVLDNLDKAEAYQITENSQAMRTYALNVLDNLDVVVRLPFIPALADSLPQDAVIKRIVAREGDNELYLLNQTDGHVIRATLTERGYQIDPDFICEPVPKPLIVGGLVDIISLPLDDPNNATIMGMDANGNLMQCVPGGTPPLTSQMPPPDMNWGTPTAFDMNAQGLYVLDPVTNAVWIFWRTDEFSELPTLFFDEHIPPMGDVIDLTLNRDDLFMIHNDGHLTTCAFGYPTRCQDPAMIKDVRDGGESSPIIDDAVFHEIQFAPPPDPSLYLLEPSTPSIYHFSVRLSYQRQFRSLNPLPEGPATAFTVSPNRQVFLAIGNQIFISPLP